MAVRKKKMLTADISVERFRAKKDVAYERYKVGSEKEIQSMRESIIESTERTGQLTKERDDALQKIRMMDGVIEENHRLAGNIKSNLNDKSNLEHELQSNLKKITDLLSQVEHYKKEKDLFFTQNQRMLVSIDNLLAEYPALFYRKENDHMILLKPRVADELALCNEKVELGKFSYGSHKNPSISMKDTMTVYPRDGKDNPN